MRTWVQRIRAIAPWIAPALGVAFIAGLGRAEAGQDPQQPPAAQTPAAQTPAAQTPAAQTPGAAPAAPADPAKAQEVLAQLKSALGGDRATAMKSLSAEGTARVSFGDRQINNDLTLKIVLPDHVLRITQPDLPNGMPGPRLAWAMNGSDVWAGPLDPMPNFGGGGGGPMINGQPAGGRRGGGGGGAFFGGGGPQQNARIRGDLLRLLIGIVPGPDSLQGVTYSYVGTAQSKDGGEADVLQVKGEGLDAKLFIDKKTHLPLMATYMAQDMTRIRMPRPNANGGNQAQAADPTETPDAREKRLAAEAEKRREEVRKQLENAPMVENQVYYADYSKVDGVMLPHRFTRAVNGTPAEEIDITKYKINPKIDLNDFQKKGS